MSRGIDRRGVEFVQYAEIAEDLVELRGQTDFLVLRELKAGEEGDVANIVARNRHPRWLTQGVGPFNAAALAGGRLPRRIARVRFGNMSSRRETGEAGEHAAADYLRGLKYVIVARNYRCRGGEIDLVALHRETVVFIEVRTRSDGALVDPIESVDDSKRRRIVTAARHYAARHRLHDRAMRFDLVAVRAGARETTCELLVNAFDLNDLGPARPRW